MTDPTPTEDPLANAIAEHVTKHVGPVTNVFHEIKPAAVHLDVLVVGPTDDRPYTTLVTCGMSERPMRIPIENPEDLGLIPELRLAELLLCLPPEWPLTAEAFRSEEHYWPVRWLKKLARLPHQHDGWLGLGHTVPNGDPAAPFAPGVGFSGWMIDEPVLFPAELRKLRFDGRAINFYSIVPVYEDEMMVKLRKGGAALARLFDQAKVTELVDVSRANQGKPG